MVAVFMTPRKHSGEVEEKQLATTIDPLDEDRWLVGQSSAVTGRELLAVHPNASSSDLCPGVTAPIECA